MKYINKKLSIDKVNFLKIAKKYGTPTYCYSYSRLKENILNFKKNFKSISPLICFAVKSNTNENLINEISKFGFGADVVSVGEMMMALKAGISPKKIVFSGVGKTTNEISYAIDKKILLINAESKKDQEGYSLNLEKMIKDFEIKNRELDIKEQELMERSRSSQSQEDINREANQVKREDSILKADTARQNANKRD